MIKYLPPLNSNGNRKLLSYYTKRKNAKRRMNIYFLVTTKAFLKNYIYL